MEIQTGRRVRRDAEANRQELLATARRLFAERGVEAVSMHEIGQTAGVGQGTLYRHFRNKGELCHHLIMADISAFQERLMPLIAACGVSPLQRLETLLIEKIRLTETHLGFFEVIEQQAADLRPAKTKRGPFHTWAYEQIVVLLTEAVERAEISELDIPVTADILLAAVGPKVYSRQRNVSGFSIERIIAGVRRVCIEGLRSSVL